MNQTQAHNLDMNSGHDTCHLVQAPSLQAPKNPWKNLSQLTHPYTPLGFGLSSTGNLYQMNDKIGKSDEPNDDATSEDSEAIPGTEPDEKSIGTRRMPLLG